MLEVDFNNIPQILKNFPLSWERFGIVNGDTVTYNFCYANNPKFTLSKNYKTILIINGNEMNGTFEIIKIYYNDSIFYFKLSGDGLDDCTFKLIDKNRMIGQLILLDNYEPFNYLPCERLKNKKVIKEECDDE